MEIILWYQPVQSANTKKKKRDGFTRASKHREIRRIQKKRGFEKKKKPRGIDGIGYNYKAGKKKVAMTGQAKTLILTNHRNV